MVQGRLLTAHPGGVHGDGGAPGGDSSLRQGAGTASPGSPDLEMAAVAVQRDDWEKNFDIRGFLVEGNIGEGGQPGGPPGVLAPPWRGQPLGHATRAPGSQVVALWPHPGVSGRFRRADFLSDFSGIFGAVLIVGKPKIQKHQRTGTGNWVH